MAKKRKRGRNKTKLQKTSREVVSPEKPVQLSEKKNLFQKIYDLSIGGVRVVAVVLVILGLVLIVLGSISLFRTFKDKLKSNNEGNTTGNIDGGIQTDNSKNKNEEEEPADESDTTQIVSESAKLARIASHNKSVKTGKWVATDYKQGDLKPGKYEVQKGDTLWEISEAVYGSGFQWHQILDANSGAIGRLPNGSQALIVPGQILTIPPKYLP